MAWTTLKAAVAAVIKTNGIGSVTGANLQATVNTIIDAVGANATFGGVAITTTAPGVPDGPVFYLASTAGTYANFGALTLKKGEISVLLNTVGTWSKSIIINSLSPSNLIANPYFDGMNSNGAADGWDDLYVASPGPNSFSVSDGELVLNTLSNTNARPRYTVPGSILKGVETTSVKDSKLKYAVQFYRPSGFSGSMTLDVLVRMTDTSTYTPVTTIAVPNVTGWNIIVTTIDLSVNFPSGKTISSIELRHTLGVVGAKLKLPYLRVEEQFIYIEKYIADTLAAQGVAVVDAKVELLKTNFAKALKSVQKNVRVLDEVANFYANAGETGYDPTLFLNGATITAPNNTLNAPLVSSYLPKIINMAWAGAVGGEAKINILAAQLTSHIFTLGFWIDKASWLASPNPVFDVYTTASSWLSEDINNLITGFRRTYALGGSNYLNLEVLAQSDEWVYLLFNTASFQSDDLFIRFDMTLAAYTAGINLANLTLIKDSVLTLDPYTVYRKNSESLSLNKLKDTRAALLTSIKAGLYNVVPDIFGSEKNVFNLLYNSGESSFPQALIPLPGATQSTITTPADCPFSTDVLPTVIQAVGSGSGDFKFEFATSLMATGALTFGFWTKISQLPRTYFQIYNDTAWLQLTIPLLVGGTTTDSVTHGGTTLKRVMENGDWVFFQLQFTNYTLTPFRLWFTSASTATMYFANIVAISGIVDINPYRVRYKIKSSAYNKRLLDLETRVSVLELPKKVVCFGDSLTNGYAPVLQTALGTTYTVVNRGVGGESTKEVIGRQGGSPMYISNITIPYNTTPVVLGNLASSGIKLLMDDTNVLPLLQNTANGGINNCYVEGIECILKWTGANPSDTTGTFTIERATAGVRSLVTGAKSILWTDNMRSQRVAHLTIIFIGTNGGWSSTASTLVAQFKKMTDYLMQKRFLVISSHVVSTTQAVIDAMTAEYGSQYLDLRTYMAKYGIYDAIDGGYLSAGTYPTSTDLADMAAGNCPTSLLGVSDTTHFNTIGYQMFVNQIKLKMTELGY